MTDWERSGGIKIQLAEKHLRELEAQVEAFFNANRPRPLTERDPETGDTLYILEIDNPLPDPMLGGIAGDAIHNLRSALDLLWVHAVHAKRRQRRKKGSRGEPFRMFDSRGEFEDAFRNTWPANLEVPMGIIKQIEPYPSGQGEYLWFLRQLDNENKHEVLTPVVYTAGLTYVYGPNLGVVLQGPIPSITSTVYGTRIIEKRTLLHRGRKPIPPGMQMYPETPLICFGETPVLQNAEILQTIRGFLELTKSVVEKFRARGLVT